MLDFEELGYEITPIGDLSLRRRTEPRLGGQIIYEVKIDDDFLMSSLFTVGEASLARLGIAAVEGAALDVLVGGLGLGYTAAAALSSERVKSLIVVEAFGGVIEWHRNHLVPLGAQLVADPRCRLLCGDFFALAANPSVGFDHETPARRFDAMLLDIDHSPRELLGEGSRGFYSVDGLVRARTHLKPGGVFAMWSDEPPDEEFVAILECAFERVEAKVVAFENPYTQGQSSCTVYVCETVNGIRTTDT
ncbi:MAG: spermidine synthase [Gammaproteobacteria bacterium]|nr:spermidine synthase [Gammaproteobacteria bacterium]